MGRFLWQPRENMAENWCLGWAFSRPLSLRVASLFLSPTRTPADGREGPREPRLPPAPAPEVANRTPLPTRHVLQSAGLPCRGPVPPAGCSAQPVGGWARVCRLLPRGLTGDQTAHREQSSRFALESVRQAALAASGPLTAWERSVGLTIMCVGVVLEVLSWGVGVCLVSGFWFGGSQAS